MAGNPDILYSKSHEWVRVEGDEAVMGISDFAQEQLGDLTFVDLPAVGGTYTPGKEIGSLESVKAASEIYSPVHGKVIAVNEALNDSPEKINTDPYADGWIVRFALTSKPEGLLSRQEYESFIASETH